MKTFSRQIRILAAFCVASGAFFSGACNSAAGGDKIEKLSADSIAVREVLQPSGHAVSGEKVALLSRKSENLFWVYRLPDFKFLYCYGQAGEGPDDFGMCGFENHDVRMPDIYVKEYAKSRITGYCVGEKSFEKGVVFTRENSGRYRVACIADGGKWLLGTEFIPGDAMGRERLYVIDPRDGMVKDSVGIQTFSTEVSYGKGVQVTGYNDMFVLSRGDRIAVVYEETQRVDFYDIRTDGRLRTVKIVGMAEKDEDVFARVKAQAENTGKTRIADHCATEKYLYLLEVRAKFDVAARRIDFVYCRVKVYDWEGRSVKVFELEKPALRMAVQGDDSRIFAYNTITGDFDRVYVYRTGL